MATLPYITSPGNIDKALNGIKKAGVPERVTLDFVKTILKIPGGSGDQINSFLKKISLVNSDGTPNETYRKFRNPTSSGKAIAQCIKDAYAPLYVRNEYMHELNDEELIGLVVEETGHAHDSNPVKLIVSCIQHLKVSLILVMKKTITSRKLTTIPQTWRMIKVITTQKIRNRLLLLA